MIAKEPSLCNQTERIIAPPAAVGDGVIEDQRGRCNWLRPCDSRPLHARHIPTGEGIIFCLGGGLMGFRFVGLSFFEGSRGSSGELVVDVASGFYFAHYGYVVLAVNPPVGNP